MTMPTERMRAIRWGRQLLQRIAADPSVSEGLRQRAAAVLPEYPEGDALSRLVTELAPALPRTFAAALSEAVKVFNQVHMLGIGSEETRSELMRALRHFPDGSMIVLMERGTLGLESFLSPEG